MASPENVERHDGPVLRELVPVGSSEARFPVEGWKNKLMFKEGGKTEKDEDDDEDPVIFVSPVKSSRLPVTASRIVPLGSPGKSSTLPVTACRIVPFGPTVPGRMRLGKKMRKRRRRETNAADDSDLNYIDQIIKGIYVDFLRGHKVEREVDLEIIWDVFHPAQSYFCASRPSSADHGLPLPIEPRFAASSSSVPRELRKIHEHIFELYNPKGSRPAVEIVFFHGLQLEDTHCPEISTLTSAGGWVDWVSNRFPDSRLLIVSNCNYQDWGVLLDSLTFFGNVGRYGCPVILVGHSLGGLVMTELCCYALNRNPSAGFDGNGFLSNIKSLFFLACPHQEVAMSALFRGAALDQFTRALQTVHFKTLRSRYGWKLYGTVEDRLVDMDTFKDPVVPEASERSDVDTFYTSVNADHFNECRPNAMQSSSFLLLSQLVSDLVGQDESPVGSEISSDGLVGIQSQVNLVQILLKEAPRVGIVGKGGIGKTTLAKTLYNTISDRFEFTCFIQDVKNILTTEENPNDLRAKIKMGLYFKGRKVNDDFEWGELKGKRVLIVLDNVMSSYHLRVMTKSDGFALESRVIVTSLSSGFLEAEDFAFYSMMGLNDRDSRTLVCLNAFKKCNTPAGCENSRSRMAKFCGGHPVALIETGKVLGNRSKELWDRVLNMPERPNGTDHGQMMTMLSFGYDRLSQPEQRMFLDVAIFFHGERLAKAAKIWKMCGWQSIRLTWANLLERGLVTETHCLGHDDFLERLIFKALGLRDTDVEDCIIQMHERFRELCYSKICMGQPIGVVLDQAWYELYDQVQACESDPGMPAEKPKVQVLKVSQKNSEKTDLVDISRLPGLEDLRILSLDGGSLEGEFHLFPRGLVYLKIMNIQHWFNSGTNVASGQRLEGHQNLQYLEIESCEDLEILPSSLGQLETLTHLTIRQCSNLKDLSSFSQLSALEHLMIDECSSVESLPDSLEKLEALTYLGIRSCSRLKRLPDSLSQLKSLQQLEILDCDDLVLTHTLETLGQLQGLQRVVIPLKIDDNQKFRVPGEAIWELPALKHLDVMYRRPSDFPSFTLGGLPSLEYLKISEDALPGDIVRALPEALGELEALKLMWLKGTTSLSALPSTLGCLRALQVLVLEDCWDLAALPDSIGDLEALKSLTVESWNLETLPHSVLQLGALKHLHIEAPRLRALPERFGMLQGLEYLHMSGGEGEVIGMEALPDSFGELHSLKQMELRGFFRLESLPDTLEGLKSLERLTLHDFERLKFLPKTLGGLQALKELDLRSCANLRAVPDSAAKLHALEKLAIVNCKHLKTLPDVFRELRSLKDIQIESGQTSDDFHDPRGFRPHSPEQLGREDFEADMNW